MALLHILSELFPATRKIAVYIDHGLRPNETGAERQLVQKHATICMAEFETTAVNVQCEKEKSRCSLEEAARTLRYREFEKIRLKYQAASIAVGHTSNDQAEEVLLRLLRGSGSTGLAGMKQHRGNIIRPLLHETKESLLSYLKEHHIPFCQDSSNFDTTLLRNKIRLELMPYLEQQYNASMQQTLLRTAAILSDEDSLLVDLTNKILPHLLKKEPGKITLSLPLFYTQHIAIQRRVLDTICWTLQSKPSFTKIQNLLNLKTDSKHKEIHLTDGLRAVKNKDTILFHRPSSTKGYRGTGIVHKSFSPINIPCPGSYPVPELKHTLAITRVSFSYPMTATPGALFLDADTVDFPLLLRSHTAEDYFHPMGAPGGKKVARFLSDKKVPIMERSNYPLLLFEGNIVALTGIRIDHKFRITESTSQVLRLRWQKN